MSVITPLHTGHAAPNTALDAQYKSARYCSHMRYSFAQMHQLKKPAENISRSPYPDAMTSGDAPAKISQVYLRFRVRSVQNWTRLQTNEFNWKVGQQRNNTQDRD